MSKTLEDLLALQTELDELADACESQSALVDTLKEKVDDPNGLAADVDRLTKRVDEQQKVVTAAQDAANTIPQVEQSLAQTRDKLKTAKSQLAALLSLIDPLKQVVDGYARTGHVRPEDVQQLEQQFALVRGDLPSEARQEIDGALLQLRTGTLPAELQRLVDRLQRILQDLQATVNQLEHDEAELQRRLVQLKWLAGSLPAASALLHSLEQQLTDVKASYDEAERSFRMEQTKLLAQQAQIKTNRDALQAALDALLGSLNPGLPIALLPARLETRFTSLGGKECLAIRIYPDDIHIDSHHTKLSSIEAEKGNAFWGALRTIDGQRHHDGTPLTSEEKTELKAQQWNDLASRFGPSRAAWIARRSKEGLSRDDIDDAQNAFEAYARGLPDRWLALGYNNENGRDLKRVFAQWSRLIGRHEPPDSAAWIGGELATGFSQAPTGGTVGKDIAWKVDFDEALKAGMGICVPLNGEEHFDLVLVLGVRATLDPDESQQRLEALLNAHHYTWGMGFVPQGSPTNNTAEARSAYTRYDLGYASSFKLDILDSEPPLRADEGVTNAAFFDAPDGTQAAAALGISADVLAHVSNANGQEQRNAYAMHMALWPATWGYFLEVPLGMPRTLLSEMRARLKTWPAYFARYVRARGPLPILRVGNQPYGLLPVTSLDNWQPIGDGQTRSTTEADMWEAIGRANILRKLRDNFWEVAVNRKNVPSLANVQQTNGDEADRNIIRALGVCGTSQAIRRRELIDGDFLSNFLALYPFSASDPGYDEAKELEGKLKGTKDEWRAFMQYFTADILAISFEPRLARMVFEGGTSELYEPLVTSDPLSDSNTLSDTHFGNYIDKLCSMSPADLCAFLAQRELKVPLLWLLLAFSTVRTYVKAGQEHKPADVEEPSTVDFDSNFNTTATPSLTASRYLSTVGQYLYDLFDDCRPREGLAGADLAASSMLAEHLAALKQLAGVSTAELERLLIDCLDLSSHRLDAWITSVATWRLHELRAKNCVGIYLGGYGWVENLHKKDEKPVSTGFIHAPSPTHAAAAAVLRSGYLSHKNAADQKGLAINLTSARTRVALELIDGVRQGQPLAALLGYLFERRLQEVSDDLMQYLPALRQYYPLNVSESTRAQTRAGAVAAESIAAHDVVDGLRMARDYQDYQQTGGSFPFDRPGITLPAEGTDLKRQLEDVLKALLDAFDAVSDVAVSEAVFQAVQGNFVRTGGTVDAVSRGEVPLTDIEVVRTPRTGTSLAHRLLVVFSQTEGGVTPSAATARWGPPRPRGIAEPHLNEWAATLFGDPANIRCRVRFIDATTKEPLKNVPLLTVSLDSLGLCPLDLLYAEDIVPGECADAAATLKEPPSELELRIAYHALVECRPPAVDDAQKVGVCVLYDRPTGNEWDRSVISLAEALEMVRAARSVVTNAQPLAADHLFYPALPKRMLTPPLPASDPNSPAYVMGARANAARDELDKANKAMSDALAVYAPEGAPVDLSAWDHRKVLGDKLIALASFGVEGAVPLLPSFMTKTPPRDKADGVAAEWTALVEHCKNALSKAQEKLDKCDKVATGNISAESQLQASVVRLHSLFSDGFRVVPPFALKLINPDPKDTDPDKPNALIRALQHSMIALANNGLTAAETVRWFARAARFRERVAQLNQLLLYSGALSQNTNLAFSVAQLPYDPEDRWVGLAGKPVRPGRTSLVLHAPHGLDLDQPLVAGLWIDGWDEVVPNETETTTVAFHYDAPNSAAPQAILLAVAPNVSETWDLLKLESILLETYNLVKLRAATLYDIEKPRVSDVRIPSDAARLIGRCLPALFFPNNPTDDTVSLLFTEEP